MKETNKMKQNKGFTGVDLTIAVIILMLFVSLISTLFYNVYLSSSSTKRATVANGYLIDVLEQIDQLTYDQVIEDSKIAGDDVFLGTIKQKINGNSLEIIRGKVDDNTTTTKPYTLGIHIQNYNETEGNTGKQDLVKNITVTIKYRIGKKAQIKEMTRQKTKEVATQDKHGIVPEIIEGMKPVKWIDTDKQTGEGYWQVTTVSDPNWFDYSQKKWANSMLQDGLTTDDMGRVLTMGSMFVYIPRFAYQIPAANYHTSQAGEISIAWLTTANQAVDGTSIDVKKVVTSDVAGSQINSTTNYIQHPAFTFGEKELPGIWVSKFEASNPGCSQDISTGEVSYSSVTDKKVQAKPGITSWRNIKIGEAYTECLKIGTTNASNYGITSGKGVDSHLMKNTEWGAIAYLTNSKYGKNSKVYLNNNSSYLTGMAGDTVDAAASSETINSYNTKEGQQASTTGNRYGIYDMSGGAWEYVAAYLNNGNSNLTLNGQDMQNASDRYKTIYDVGNPETQESNYKMNNRKYGDATWETSMKHIGAGGSWHLGYSNYPYSNEVFYGRGGSYHLGQNAGIFSFDYSGGNSNTNSSFRPCLIQN